MVKVQHRKLLLCANIAIILADWLGSNCDCMIEDEEYKLTCELILIKRLLQQIKMEIYTMHVLNFSHIFYIIFNRILVFYLICEHKLTIRRQCVNVNLSVKNYRLIGFLFPNFAISLYIGGSSEKYIVVYEGGQSSLLISKRI